MRLVTSCKYRVVFVGNIGLKAVPPVSDWLKTSYIKADELDVTISSMEIMPDHVHLLI